ncbi:hypothetical protein [Klebsiella michiganensis]|uniref:hypothetical protein n=1 Tax=Klebsiella michiganensis TaxID=1134687 RepID=UPI001C8B38A7|nr:hypothetical protein [Klebsiella michiganensis]
MREKKYVHRTRPNYRYPGGGDDFANRRRFMLNQEAARRTLAAQAIIFAAEG